MRRFHPLSRLRMFVHALTDPGQGMPGNRVVGNFEDSKKVLDAFIGDEPEHPLIYKAALELLESGLEIRPFNALERALSVLVSAEVIGWDDIDEHHRTATYAPVGNQKVPVDEVDDFWTRVAKLTHPPEQVFGPPDIPAMVEAKRAVPDPFTGLPNEPVFPRQILANLASLLVGGDGPGSNPEYERALVEALIRCTPNGNEDYRQLAGYSLWLEVAEQEGASAEVREPLHRHIHRLRHNLGI